MYAADLGFMRQGKVLAHNAERSKVSVEISLDERCSLVIQLFAA